MLLKAYHDIDVAEGSQNPRFFARWSPVLGLPKSSRGCCHESTREFAAGIFSAAGSWRSSPSRSGRYQCLYDLAVILQMIRPFWQEGIRGPLFLLRVLGRAHPAAAVHAWGTTLWHVTGFHRT